MQLKIHAVPIDRDERKRKEPRPVNVFHWAPGKKFQNGCPIPTFLVKEAKRMKSKRLIYTEVQIEPDTNARSAINNLSDDVEYPKEGWPISGTFVTGHSTIIVSSWLFCRKEDTVDIDNGIALAVSRLAVELDRRQDEVGWALSL